MSGSTQIPPIPLRFEGAENVQRTIDAIVARVGQLEAAGKGASASFGTLRTQAEQAGGAFRNTGQIIGQAGYQVQDFAVQVASGQSALTAFVQQGSQLAGIFGPGGAVAGAVLAIGGIAAQFLLMGENAEEAKRRTEASFKGMAEAGRDITNVLREINQLFLTASQRAAAAANAQVGNLQADTRRLLDVALQRNEGNSMELVRAQRELAEIERGIQRRRDETYARTGSRVSDADRGDESRLFAARASVAGLEQDMARQSQRIGDLQAALRRLENAGIITSGGEEYGPGSDDFLSRQREAERAARTGARAAARRDPNQYGPLDGSPQSQMQLERGRIQAEEAAARDQEKRARELTRELERQEDANRRTTDRIVDYSASAFADLFEENGQGFEGLMETFEKTAKQTFARIAAEAIIRPMVEPVVSGLGLGSFGSANGGFSGLFGGAVSGRNGAAATVGGSGGSSAGGGIFSGLGGYVSNPVWQPGMGWFAADVSKFNAASSAAPWMVPSIPGTGGGGILSSLGASSLGNYAAGIGGGFMAGSALGGYLAGQSTARQTNAQIGAGGGAVAGAIAGTMIMPGIGTVVGGLIGGLAGGAGGGLIGPGKGFSGGDVGVSVDANGFLTIGRVGGKNWDSGASRQQSQQQLDQINAVLRGAGVTIGGLGGAHLGYQGYGGSHQVFGPTEMWGAVRNNLGTSNPTLAAALRQPWMQSFEDLGVIAPYSAANDNLTRALASGGIGSRVDFNSAAEFITGTYEPMLEAARVTSTWTKALQDLTKTYNTAIGRAHSLGLAEEELTAARDKARQDILDDRSRAVGNAMGALRVDELRTGGNTRQGALLEFDLGARERRAQMGDFLESYGFAEGGSIHQDTMKRLDALAESQRQEMLKGFTTTLNDAVRGLRIGELQAGTPAQQRQASLLQFDFAAEQQRTSLLGTLRNAGFADDSNRSTSLMQRLNDLLATQRKTLAEQMQGGGASSGLLQELLYGEASGMTGAARFAAGQTVLEKYRRAGDLDAYTSAAQRFLPGARDYLGSSERYGDMVADMRKTIARMGGDPDGLLQSVNYQSRTADGVERLVSVGTLTHDEMKALRAEIGRLSAQIAALARRNAG
jgi:hypothetical protein